MKLLIEFSNSFLDIAWVIELALLALTWTILCGKAKKVWEWLIHILCLLCVFAIANIMLFFILGGVNYYFISLWGYVHGIISAIYMHWHSPYKRKTWLLLWLALYNSVLSIAAFSGQCSALFGVYIMRGPIEGVIRCIIYCLMPLTALYLRRYKFDEFPFVPRSGLVLVGILCLCVQVLSLVEAYFFMAGSAVQFVLAFVYASMMLTSLASIQAMYTMCKEQKDIMDLQVEKQRYLAEREINQIAANSLEDLRCIRHDIKNQFSFCQILLEEERYEELKSYFSKYKEHLPQQLKIIDCGNHIFDTVLNMEGSKIRSNELLFETQLVVPPKVPFGDEDICSLITNLLDNALEECVRLKKKGNSKTKIRLEIYPHQSYLYVRCKNTTDKKSLTHMGLGLRSTKKEKDLHGYGTRIVAKIAEKYNGCADYSIEGNMFVAQVMMDITGEQI